MSVSARIVQLEIVPKDQALEDEPRILVGSYSAASPEIFSLNGDIHKLGDYPFVLEFEDQGGTNTFLKLEFLNKRNSPTVIETRFYEVAVEAGFTASNTKIRIFAEDIAIIQQKVGTIFIRITGCNNIHGASPATYYEYEVDEEPTTILEYRWRRCRKLLFGTINKSRLIFSTIGNLKLMFSTVQKERLLFSTLGNLKLMFTTINKSRLIISTPPEFPVLQIPIKAKLSLISDSSILRVEDDNTYNVSRQRDDFKIYTVLLKNEEFLAVRNSNNPDSSVLWEFNVSNGIYELFYIVIPNELELIVGEGNAYQEIIKTSGVMYVKYTIPVSKEILSCLEELNDQEIERLLEGFTTEQNRYIQAESLYISMLVAAAKNDMKTTKKLKSILEGLCINCGCGC
jgi:hypothetical protein